MKTKYKKIFKYILIFVFIILFIKVFFSENLFNKKSIDDILFFKLLSNGNSKFSSDFDSDDSSIINQYNKEYRFKIDYKNIDFKSINLANTINKDTLIYEKIAPGTSGNFNILLESNQNLRYKVLFNSLNEKPKNLNFIASIDNKLIAEENTLEKLSENLFGNIYKNQKINIKIDWYWKYENVSEESDIQDTIDAENIRRYQFNICTIGEEIN